MRQSALAIGLISTFLVATGPVHAAHKDGASPVEEAATRWTRHESESFHIYSRAPAGVTRTIIRKLEVFQQYMTRVTPFKASMWSPIEVFIFPDLESYNLYSNLPNTSGFFLATPDVNYICICADPRIASDETTYHEFTHYLLHNTFATIPLWADEGLAEYFSGFKISGQKVQTGRPKATHIAWLREHGIIPLKNLMQINTESVDYREGESQGTLYAQSWAIIHYLLRDAGGDHGDGLLRYLEEVGNGADPAARLPVCLGKSTERIDSAVLNYVTRDEYTVGEVELDGGPGADEELENVPPAEVLTKLGAFLARNEKVDAEWSRQHLDAAEKLGGSPGEIDLARAWMLVGARKETEALHVLDELVAREPVNWPANFALGSLQILTEIKNAAGSSASIDSLPPLIAEARVHLSLCANLKPDFERGLVALGRTYLFEPNPGPEGVMVLETASALSPGDNDAIAILAVLCARRGDIDRARQLVTNRLSRIADTGLGRLVDEEIYHRQANEVYELLIADRPEEALAKLKEQRDATSNSEDREMLEERIRGLDERIRRYRRVDLFNSSLDLARGGDTQAALGKLSELLDLCYEVESDADSLCHRAGELRVLLLKGAKIR